MGRFLESAPLAEARLHEQHMEKFVAASSRPCFHLTPRVGWMNDPNGFSYYKGLYHLFYQYNPYSTMWGPMHWGHAVSKDLLHWQHLPVALAPDSSYDDKNGCFSGSAIELDDGRHLLMYTGAGSHGYHADGSVREVQTQCLAIGDGVNYEKVDSNPVIDGSSLPMGSNISNFRDPKIWREDDGTYRAVIANLGPDHSGQILMYTSEDAMSWKYSHVVSRNKGRYGIMWECPELFELDGRDVLLVSPQDMIAEGHRFNSGNGTLYIVGDVDEQTGEISEDTLETIDNGIDFYATQTVLTPDGRRVMIAWMQNWDTIPVTVQGGRWFGQMTVPRELSVRNDRLYQWPVRELESCRKNQVMYQDIELSRAPVELDNVRGRVIDLLLDVRPADEANPYKEFVVWFAQDERYHCSLRYRPAEGRLTMSRVHAGSRRAAVHHRKCDVADATTRLSLRLVMDKYSVEVFVNGGIHALTMTIPTSVSADRITFSARGNVIMDVEKYDLC